MDRIVDLDAAVKEIERRRPTWASAGFSVGPVTWRDEAQGSPWVLKTDRTAVADPDSVGVELRRADAEASVVLFRGGWADVELMPGGARPHGVVENPDVSSVLAFGRLLDEVFARLNGEVA